MTIGFSQSLFGLSTQQNGRTVISYEKTNSGKNVQVETIFDDKNHVVQVNRTVDYNNDGNYEENELWEVNIYKNRVGDCRCDGVIIDQYYTQKGQLQKRTFEYDENNDLLNKTTTQIENTTLKDIKNGTGLY